MFNRKKKTDLENYFKKLMDNFFNIKASSNDNEIPLQKAIEEVIKEIAVKKNKEKVIIIGNGGSASIASHLAIDLCKNVKIKAITFNEASLLTCISNDYGYEYVFQKPIEIFANKGDLLIAISSSGKSLNILRAVSIAKKKGCRVITLSGFSPNNPLRKSGDINFYVPASLYGIVEIAHTILCHFIVDSLLCNYE